MRVLNSLFNPSESANFGQFLENNAPTIGKTVGIATAAIGISAVTFMGNAGLYSHFFSLSFQCLAVKTGLSTNYFQTTTFICAFINTIFASSEGANGATIVGGLFGIFGHKKIGYSYAKSAGLGAVIAILYKRSLENPGEFSELALKHALALPVGGVISWIYVGGLIALHVTVGKYSAQGIEWATTSTIRFIAKSIKRR
ncbi:MAG: hypothetical protein K1000chlam2_01048 [Chlamydiae bacterium]|nr:hypothetical protein [Chlamydiota bacterium]